MGKHDGYYSKKPVGGRPPFPPEVKNGRIPLSLLGRCETQSHLAHPLLYKPAARAMDAMVKAAQKDGVTIRAVALYRDYAGQVRMKQVWTARGKPNNAARPGTSNHGWGVAEDLDVHLPGVLKWMHANGPKWGWDAPTWAVDGIGTEENWHFEFIQGFQLPSPEPEIPVYVNGHLIPDADGYREEDGVWVALRPVAEALGWQVKAEGGQAELTFGGQAKTSIEYETHADGRGFVPVRLLATRLQVPLHWEAATQSVRLG